ncbi:crotonase/enoyl-CoA hydratase family protein [Futiania mangrovi]|uniref:Crotonase/enoyl-CoA hydratase family protein n=1 Tax=Futiania mangrovi TaxID=2959716 RepID=A0A9J6P7X3_9PROT|nr:crotonase/enoyl-CoA hydratase family protein [Futiania mangrovii]MCP1335396.1 crotonase/enoyl-CoA hydratase family protein [Futiania mangrovii]
MTVRYETDETIAIVTIDRPDRRNAVDRDTAEALVAAFTRFEEDETLTAAVFTGAGGVFCAGADLKKVSEGALNRVEEDGPAPMGPSRMLLSKPVIGAIEGFAVAGGLELALWCDMRVAARDAVFGVYCRRFGVPLIDLGTVRLPRLIGMSRAMDMILTGRPVSGEEALSFGLANRLVERGQALAEAVNLAKSLAMFPQTCLRSDRLSAHEQWALGWEEAWKNELARGRAVLASGETVAGATAFAHGKGRGGRFGD